MILPNLLVIGGQKCGSTWIHKKLALHNKCFMSKTKELTFFLKPEDEQELNEYIGNFPVESIRYKYVGESTPVYFWTYDEESEYCNDYYGNKNIASSVLKTLGDNIQIVLSLRNPVDRAISAYLHHFKMGRFKGDESILDVGKRFGLIDMGFYKRHLEHWHNYFSTENFTVIFFDDIKQNPGSTLKIILDSLDLEDDFRKVPDVNKQDNPGFTLKVEEDYITIDMESMDKLNKKVFKEGALNIQDDFVVPKIYKHELESLQKLYMNDIQYIQKRFNRDDLGWDSVIQLEAFLNN